MPCFPFTVWSRFETWPVTSLALLRLPCNCMRCATLAPCQASLASRTAVAASIVVTAISDKTPDRSGTLLFRTVGQLPSDCQGGGLYATFGPRGHLVPSCFTVKNHSFFARPTSGAGIRKPPVTASASGAHGWPWARRGPHRDHAWRRNGERQLAPRVTAGRCLPEWRLLTGKRRGTRAARETQKAPRACPVVGGGKWERAGRAPVRGGASPRRQHHAVHDARVGSGAPALWMGAARGAIDGATAARRREGAVGAGGVHRLYQGASLVRQPSLLPAVGADRTGHACRPRAARPTAFPRGLARLMQRGAPPPPPPVTLCPSSASTPGSTPTSAPSCSPPPGLWKRTCRPPPSLGRRCGRRGRRGASRRSRRSARRVPIGRCRAGCRATPC